MPGSEIWRPKSVALEEEEFYVVKCKLCGNHHLVKQSRNAVPFAFCRVWRMCCFFVQKTPGFTYFKHHCCKISDLPEEMMEAWLDDDGISDEYARQLREKIDANKSE